MRRINSKIYDDFYYQDHIMGFEEMLCKLIPHLGIKKDTRILDLGCGAGDLSFYLAKRGASVIGVDYSIDAIKIAKQKLDKSSDDIQKKVTFMHLDAKDISFKSGSFDMIVSIDVFEHLYPEELDLVMKKIKKILVHNGKLLVHTEANIVHLDFTHKYYIYPISQLLVYLNKLVTKKIYPSMPKESRNELHKIQHVNEPTYFSLRKMFIKNEFSGKIYHIIPFKPHLSWKDILFNIIVYLYPFSKLPPLSWFFAYDYICVMENK